LSAAIARGGAVIERGWRAAPAGDPEVIATAF
jgi:hypothetical protein